MLEEDFSTGAPVAAAVQGATVLVGRNLGVQSFAFVATIVLARLLSPQDFGAFAIALVIQQSGWLVANFGLPSALIRRKEPPTDAELRSASTLVLILGTVIALMALVLGIAVLPAFGGQSRIANLVGIACFSLPILGFQLTPVVLLNRRLDFGRIAAIEIADAIAFYAFALAAAAAGLGPYSLAGAVPAAAVVGLVVASALVSWNWALRFRWSELRGLAAFGVQVGLFESGTIIREISLVTVLAAVGGQAMAGFYGITRRLLSVPNAAIIAIQRVAMPALARTGGREERTRRAAQAESVSVLAVGLPMALVAGSANSLISVLFGARWLPAADLLTFASPGMLLFAGAGAILTSLALANRDARATLEATATQIAVMLGLVVALVPEAGTAGAGVAVTTGFVAFCIIILARAPRGAVAVAAVARGIAIAAAAAGLGRLVAPGTSPVDGAVCLSVTGCTWLLLARLMATSELALLLGLLRSHLRPAVATQRPSEAA